MTFGVTFWHSIAYMVKTNSCIVWLDITVIITTLFKIFLTSLMVFIRFSADIFQFLVLQNGQFSKCFDNLLFSNKILLFEKFDKDCRSLKFFFSLNEIVFIVVVQWIVVVTKYSNLHMLLHVCVFHLPFVYVYIYI